jgi:hypothetical protein
MRLVDLVGYPGVTYRAADYWCRKGYVPDVPDTGSGYSRNLTDTQALTVILMGALARAGITGAHAAPPAQQWAAELLGRGLDPDILYRVTDTTFVVTPSLHVNLEPK